MKTKLTGLEVFPKARIPSCRGWGKVGLCAENWFRDKGTKEWEKPFVFYIEPLNTNLPSFKTGSEEPINPTQSDFKYFLSSLFTFTQ